MKHRYTLAHLYAAAVVCLSPAVAEASSVYIFQMIGFQVVPPTPSTAHGFCFVTFTPALDTLICTIQYGGLGTGRTSLDVHSGWFEANGPVVLNIAGPGGASDTLSVRLPWPASLRPLVQDNNEPVAHLYMELDSQNYPGGEIRGQFVRPPDGVKAASWGLVRRSYR